MHYKKKQRSEVNLKRSAQTKVEAGVILLIAAARVGVVYSIPLYPRYWAVYLSMDTQKTNVDKKLIDTAQLNTDIYFCVVLLFTQ